MPLDVLATPGAPDNVRVIGSLNIQNPSSLAAQAVSTGTAVIVVPTNTSRVKLTAAAATTGASLPAGTIDGQILIIIITTAAANTVTFAASGTSNVAGGTSVSLAGLAAHMFVWDAVAALWFQVGPLTN